MEANEGAHMLVGSGPTPNCSKHNTSVDIQEHQCHPQLLTVSLPPQPQSGNDPALGHMRAET